MLVNIQGDDKARNKTIDDQTLMLSKKGVMEELSTVAYDFILSCNTENC